MSLAMKAQRPVEDGVVDYSARDLTPTHKRLLGRTVVVTGGSSGIGKVIARRCAEEGAFVVILDRTEHPREGGLTTTEAIIASLTAQGENGDEEAIAARSCFVQGDVSEEAAHQRALDAAIAIGPLRRVDVWINNAAIGTDKPLLETTLADFERVMKVNASGVFNGCKAAVGQMILQEPLPTDLWDGTRGRVVNISSQHGMVCAPNDIAYGTGKAAVVYMTKQIGADYGAQGIVCNAVAPGKIMTGKPGPASSAESVATSSARTPYGRLGRPLDVAKCVIFLACSESSFVLGTNLMCDGGWMAG